MNGLCKAMWAVTLCWLAIAAMILVLWGCVKLAAFAGML